VSIVGDRGAQSFAPNPGVPGTTQTIVWRNNDSVTHRIVLNDSPVDTGDIAPGASSRAIALPASGAHYHCTIHPGMVGSIESSSGQPAPPCTGTYC
jgi:plastocyanin